MIKPHVLVLGGYGINCETETMHAFELAGATAEYVHVNDLIDGTKSVDDFQIMAFPGGFSYGDHTGAGKAMANRIRNNLEEKIRGFLKRDTLVIGICNGFQVLTSLGLLPANGGAEFTQQAALLKNASNRYICKWVHLKNQSKKCVWTRGIDEFYVPIAHGEGQFYINDSGLSELRENDQIAFAYIDETGNPANGKVPINPNGAVADIAGICDETGRIFGMMPHPERHLFFTNRPDFPRKKEALLRAGKALPEAGEGRKIFENAVAYFQ